MNNHLLFHNNKIQNKHYKKKIIKKKVNNKIYDKKKRYIK